MHFAKRWLLALLFIIGMLFLSACGEGQVNTEIQVEEPEPIVLRYSSYLLDSAQAGKVYYDAIAQFEAQNPDIRIETDFIQNAGYTAGIKTRLLGGEKLDVFDTWSPSLFKEFHKLGHEVFLDLTDAEFLDQFVPSSLEAVTIDGKVYGVPEVMHSDGLIYNKTLFERMNLSVPETWEEFIEVCETLKQADIIPIALDGEWWVPQFFFGSILSNNGADADWTAKLESGQIRVTDPIFVDAMEKTKEIIDRGFVPENWQGLKHEQSKDLVGQGFAAMIIAGTWDIPSIAARNPDYEIEFMMVPGEVRTVPNINIGTYRVISSETPYPEEAKRFVAFMNGKENQERLALGASAVPSVKGYELDNPAIEKIAEAVTREDATPYWPHTVSTESLQVEILEGVNAYLAGQDLEQALADIQKAIDDDR